MRILLVSFVCLLSFFQLFGQSGRPASYVNMGVGAGLNYGGIGTKTVIGYRNSGLLIGLGTFPGAGTGYEVGAQLSEEFFFVNIGYGVVGFQQINNDPVQSVKGGTVMVGGMIDLAVQRRLFLDLGVGHTFASKNPDFDGLTGVFGIGFRLGG